MEVLYEKAIRVTKAAIWAPAIVLSYFIPAANGEGHHSNKRRIRKKRRFYHLRFTDCGKGMNGEEVRRRFTPYFTTKNTERNFGLGLVYCKNVVEKNGGRIRAESEQGRGTTVTIELPARRVMVGAVERAGDSDG